MKKTLLFFGIVLAFVAVDFASAPMRMIHYALASIIGFITISALEVFVLYRCKNLRPRTILLASLLGFAILNLPSRFMHSSEYSLPDFLFRLTAILLAYLFFRVRRKTGKIGIGIVGCALLAMAYPITENWCNYMEYGTINGHSEKPVSIESMPVKEIQGQTASCRFDPEKTYVLYFWTNRCGYCHKYLPDFQYLYEQYGRRDDMSFLAVNPLDAPAAENFVSSQSDIPCFYTTQAFADRLGVKGFPTVVVIRDNRMVFFGNTTMVKKFLTKNN